MSGMTITEWLDTEAPAAPGGVACRQCWEIGYEQAQWHASDHHKAGDLAAWTTSPVPDGLDYDAEACTRWDEGYTRAQRDAARILGAGA